MDNFFLNFCPIFLKFLAKCRVLCLELKQGRRQLQMGSGAAKEGKRGGPSLYIAWDFEPK